MDYPDARKNHSNDNWICCSCRVARRYPKASVTVPVCSSCGQKMFCIGSKSQVPKKTNTKAWQAWELFVKQSE